MPARFSAYPPDRAALSRLLDDGTSYRIGRTAECELRIDHPSVSRFHAELRGGERGWHLHDTGSKNGLRVDGHIVLNADVAKALWFSIGDVYCLLEPLDAASAALQVAYGETRRATSRALSAGLAPNLGIGTLIPQTLDVMLELSGMERGFVLYGSDTEPLRVRASRGLVVDEIARASFAGSVAAVERALDSGQSVVCCDTDESPWLGSRPSVRLGGIRALLCVPLRLPNLSLGVIYADSRKPGPPVTELDLELVENLAQQASAALAAARLETEVARLLSDVAGSGEIAPRWEDLRARPRHPPPQD